MKSRKAFMFGVDSSSTKQAGLVLSSNKIREKFGFRVLCSEDFQDVLQQGKFESIHFKLDKHKNILLTKFELLMQI